MTDKGTLDRQLVLEMVRVTEAAAIAAAQWRGLGREKEADQAAVETMRAAFNKLYIDGTVVIGEGERDDAPMLFIGEKVGLGGVAVDIALDPLEGTGLTARWAPDSMAVLAIAEKGNLLNAPDVYMDKIAIGGGYPQGLVDLDKSPTENVKAMAAAKNVAVGEITVCVLDRPRHEKLIHELRAIGVRLRLIPDGDIAGVIATTEPDTAIDLYLGQGGAPEGVLAAAALNCVGGQFQGRLVFRNDDEKERAQRIGITDLHRKYQMHELACGDTIFAATGVTDGTMMKGVSKTRIGWRTHSLVMRASTRTVRHIRSDHIKHEINRN
ncbi:MULTISPECIES: class II fructose-bisphosphatase [unclassified Iodidimonas]|jgi:fructose-1,6-bisphosphatase II / sedoheptulose-1,7-bisphosphatase|uniref:class II fructose-bisphosphatase n=1 Tax=unclassified Iodidimonas TaxID=2626145 RepID=UPI0024826D1B|nr:MULTISPECIES: class II fructose-bisphosphatase [unclassified Iodidimonas]